ncbi:MAG: hypothetical protein ACKVH8_05465 [Pirellulales bacterium]
MIIRAEKIRVAAIHLFMRIASISFYSSNLLQLYCLEDGLFFEKCSPMMIDAAQSDGWQQDVCVSVESICRGRYNRLQNDLE